MNVSARHILETISKTIEHDVFPELSASDWTASRLRSSLALLKYLEHRVPEEGPYRYQECMASRSFLESIQPLLDKEKEHREIRLSIEKILEEPLSKEAYPSVEALAEQQERYAKLMDKLLIILNRKTDKASKNTLELKDKVVQFLKKQCEREIAVNRVDPRYSSV